MLVATAAIALPFFYIKQEYYSHRIYITDLNGMNARQYIELLKKVTILDLSQDTLPQWPRRIDIPYLLSVSDSVEYAGMPSFGYWQGWRGFKNYRSTVGINAVNLLKSIKENKFQVYANEYPPDAAEILKWASQEAPKIEEEYKNDGKAAYIHWLKGGLSDLHPYELSQMIAQEYIDMLVYYEAQEVVGYYPTFTLKDEDFLSIKNWPPKTDLPYLLTQLNNQSACASLDPYGGMSMKSIRTFSAFEFKTTVAQESLRLLKAIKVGEFRVRSTVEESEKESLVTWARAESARMKAGE